MCMNLWFFENVWRVLINFKIQLCVVFWCQHPVPFFQHPQSSAALILPSVMAYQNIRSDSWFYVVWELNRHLFRKRNNDWFTFCRSWTFALWHDEFKHKDDLMYVPIVLSAFVNCGAYFTCHIPWYILLM